MGVCNAVRHAFETFENIGNARNTRKWLSSTYKRCGQRELSKCADGTSRGVKWIVLTLGRRAWRARESGGRCEASIRQAKHGSWAEHCSQLDG